MPAAPLLLKRLLRWTASCHGARGSPLRARSAAAPQGRDARTALTLGDPTHPLRTSPYLRDLRSARCRDTQLQMHKSNHSGPDESRAALDRSAQTTTATGDRGTHVSLQCPSCSFRRRRGSQARKHGKREHGTMKQRPDSATAAAKNTRIRKGARDAPPESRAAVARPQRPQREDWAEETRMAFRRRLKRLPDRRQRMTGSTVRYAAAAAALAVGRGQRNPAVPAITTVAR